jgi:transmembrane sensor
MTRLKVQKSVAMAAGRPLDSSVADAAADWLTLTMSDEVTAETWEQLSAWRRASPEHERAWLHVEAVIGRLQAKGGAAGYRALSAHVDLGSIERRKLLSILFYAGAFGLTASVGSRTQSWQRIIADYQTATGEQRQVALSDGTRILLNTSSAIDVTFDAELRLVRLLAGEIMVTTGHQNSDNSGGLPPFVVETPEGRIRALGTRFSVSQEEGATTVGVDQNAVEITPMDRPEIRYRLNEQQRTVFTRSGVGEKSILVGAELAWTHGQLIADEQSLGDFLAGLSRYRAGIIRCHPSVAGLRFSGVFPLADTDVILSTLPTVLPVSVHMRTRYWVVVQAAA